MTRPPITWYIVDSLPSTNGYAKELAKGFMKGVARGGEGVHPPEGSIGFGYGPGINLHAVLARHQTAGYGKMRRPWQMGRGNLALSLLIMNPGVAASRLGQLSLLTAVAVGQVLDAYVPQPSDIAFKWPNDILLQGKKCAGILVESETPLPSSSFGQGVDHCPYCVVGIGVNVATHPTDLPYPANALSNVMEGSCPDPLALAQEIAAAFMDLYYSWQDRGFSVVRHAWEKRAWGLGQEAIVVAPGSAASSHKPHVSPPGIHHRGVFSGLDDTGALVLEDAVTSRTSTFTSIDQLLFSGV